MPNRMFKFRLYPSKAQREALDEHLEICRSLYNWLLLYAKGYYKETGRTISYYMMQNILPQLKLTKPELLKVHSQVLQNVAKRIKDAHNNFHARRRAGLKAGLPRFKKWSRYKSITYPQSGFRIDGCRLGLSKVGNIRIKLHRDLPETMKTLTVKRTPSGKWFAVFSCVVEEHPREKPRKEVGIDVGLDSFAVLSDGARIGNPRHYRRGERRLARLQRSLSRKERGSSNREKAGVRVARLHEKIRNRRDDFLHKVSRRIADTYRTVYVEDLKIRNMVKNHCLAKSISDAGWGRFIDMICYKEEESGGRLIKVNPYNTSQRCSQCGNIVEKSLSDRLHECPYCGLVLDRDLNASRNILKIGREPPESTPVESPTSAQPLGVVQVNPMKQEASLLVGR